MDIRILYAVERSESASPQSDGEPQPCPLLLLLSGATLLSQTVEYALRAATYLATSPDEPRTVDQIAEATLVPVAYLAKVMQALVRGGIVSSRRGVGGGFMLVRSPRELRILEIVQAVDPIQRITTCPLGLASHGTNLCPLHRRLDNALAAMEDAFSTTTLAEVLAEPSSSVPLCGFPGGKPAKSR